MGKNYQVGDCLLSSMSDNASENADQFDIIEETIKAKLDQITDIKMLNKVQTMTDD